MEEVTNWLGYPVTRGSVLEYTCHPGHVLEGSHVSWCDGILWNSSAPVCSRLAHLQDRYSYK